MVYDLFDSVNMKREGWDKYFFFADNPVRNLGRKRPARTGANSFGEGKEELHSSVKVPTIFIQFLRFCY